MIRSFPYYSSCGLLVQTGLPIKRVPLWPSDGRAFPHCAGSPYRNVRTTRLNLLARHGDYRNCGRAHPMKIYDLHSKRQARGQRETTAGYQYTDIPQALRVQIVHMWKAGFGEPTQWSKVPELFSEICGVLCREYGLFDLTQKREPAFTKVANFMLETKNVEQVLDVIEITFNFLDRVVRKNPRKFASAESVDAVIIELNARFRDHCVGYHYQAGQIIRVHSDPVEAEDAKPVPELEHLSTFGGANEEYLSAQGHYNHAQFAECLCDCVSAFDGAIKAVCVKRNWPYNAEAETEDLLDILCQQGMIPLVLRDHFNGVRSAKAGFIPLFMLSRLNDLRSTLRAGVPALRNKRRRNEKALEPGEVTQFMASYALRVVAANIQLVQEADRAFEGTEFRLDQATSPTKTLQLQR